MVPAYDRTAEDLGNIVGLGHVNLAMPDQQLATLFYVAGLGLTRDPFLNVSTGNMWINVGCSQFHLPTGEPQTLRGHASIVLSDREALLRRLTAVRKHLDGTRFDFRERETFVETTCPWGNRIRCYEPDERFGRVTLGIASVEFEVPPNTADGIARFYNHFMHAPATVVEDEQGRHALVQAGDSQDFVFRETGHAQAPYDGHHVQVYVADFSGAYRRLLDRGLISDDREQHQYRFKDLLDPETGQVLFTIEHEIRSMRHPLYARPLINRNPAQTGSNYAPGHDAWSWQMGHTD